MEAPEQNWEGPARIYPFDVIDLSALASIATMEGVRNVAILAQGRLDGTALFDGKGEALFAVLHKGSIIGIGGVSRQKEMPSALRMRRLYVHPEWRRNGVARALATRMVAQGLSHVELLTCNAQATKAAPLFWEAMGFVAVEHASWTHVLAKN